MRKLKPNEKKIKEYDRFVLIEVACPHEQSYKTTIDKWERKDHSPYVLKDEGHHKLNGSF